MTFQYSYIKGISRAQLPGEAGEETHSWVGGGAAGREAVCRC